MKATRFILSLLAALIVCVVLFSITYLDTAAPGGDVPREVTDTTLVYIQNTSEKFHTPDCRYTTDKSTPLTRAEAIVYDLTPCKVCNP